MEELRIKIIELCNNSKLPVEAIMFVVKDVYRDTCEIYQKQKLQEGMTVDETTVTVEEEIPQD